MLTLIYLGTGAAVPGPGRDNTSLAIDSGEDATLVDVSGSPLKRLAEAGISHDRLARVIITHEHLDHTYGLPSLLQSLWLSGRREPLALYALPDTWRFLDRLVDAYRPGSWTDAFPIDRHLIGLSKGPFLETSEMSIRAAPGLHSVPTVALRIESAAGSIVTYSSDTSPCEAVVSLARRSDLLIHEATFLAGAEDAAIRSGHSSAAHAAEVSARAEATGLVLVHFTPQRPGDLDALRDGASRVFSGPIEVPSDGATLTLP